MIRTVSVTASSLFLAASAAAHHSFAPYEQDRQLAFSGTVTSFEWTTPHIYIRLDATGEDGETRNWLIECASPQILNRVGWRWNMIGEGDVISVVVSPLRNGEPAALLKAVRLADGSEYDNGGPAGPARIDFDGKPLASAAAGGAR
jgi:hypothetical protein